jgi:hypothetical protein
MTVITARKDCKTTIHKNLTALAGHYGWSKWTLYKKRFPFVKNGYVIDKEAVL